MPINIIQAIYVVTIGILTVTPARARSPTPRPTKILSPTLYKALTTKPTMAGIENLSNNFEMFPLPSHQSFQFIPQLFFCRNI